MPASSYNNHGWTVEENQPFEITLNNGQKCLARKLQMEDVIELGIYDKLDSLTGIVETDHIERVGGKKPQDRKKKAKVEQELAEKRKEANEKEVAKALFADKKSFGKIADVISKVVSHCVIEPKIQSPWIKDPNCATEENPEGLRKLEPAEREPGMAYIDYVDITDKMTIFNAVFKGMSDLERFREEPESPVGAVADEPSDPEDAS